MAGRVAWATLARFWSYRVARARCPTMCLLPCSPFVFFLCVAPIENERVLFHAMYYVTSLNCEPGAAVRARRAGAGRSLAPHHTPPRILGPRLQHCDSPRRHSVLVLYRKQRQSVRYRLSLPTSHFFPTTFRSQTPQSCSTALGMRLASRAKSC